MQGFNGEDAPVLAQVTDFLKLVIFLKSSDETVVVATPFRAATMDVCWAVGEMTSLTVF